MFYLPKNKYLYQCDGGYRYQHVVQIAFTST